MNKQELMQQAVRNVQARRRNAQQQYEAQMEMLRANSDWSNCERKLKNAEIAVAVYHNQKEVATLEKLRALQQELMKKYNIAPSQLQPAYSCKICQDTGYVDGTTCNCLKDEFRKLLLSQSNVTQPQCTFDNSTETNAHNNAVYAHAKAACLCDKWQNILLLGQNGTGKTFLLSACANLCTQQGKSVSFLTAYHLNSLFFDCRMGHFETHKAIMNSLTDVDVLIVDDLGTELTYKGVTAEYLFALLNERIVRKKQTFFSTNLTIADLREKYDERIFSRLVDQRLTLVAKLEGNDKRLQK